MKRDMELIRLVLMDVEGEEEPDLSAYTKEQITYHMVLLIDAGFIDGAVMRGSNGYPMQADAIMLTWEGHEFLDAARNQTVWKKAMGKAKEVGSSVSMEIMKLLLVTAAKEVLGME